MDEDQPHESCITITFDNGGEVRMDKSFLIDHSQYFQAMFSGQFMESKPGRQIQLKDINYQGFMSVIDTLKNKCVQFNSIEELLSLLETSQLLLFTDTIKTSMELIKEKYLLTVHATKIFSLASKLGLKELYDKAHIYILFNFKKLLVQNRDSFFKLTEDDLLLLLNDNRLNVENEIDVFNLIIDWCKETNNDIEHEMALSCVHFNRMSKDHLQSSISKTNNLSLQDDIKKYLNCTDLSIESVGLLVKPGRSVPNVLCAMQNEDNGAYIYCWDWTVLKFTRFIKVDPLPVGTTGYYLIVKDMDIFVMAGEIYFGRGVWNESGWSYNLLDEQWRKIDNFNPFKRRHGVGSFCGDQLYLFGGLSKHRLPNERIERFRLENGTLVRSKSYLCSSFVKKVDRLKYCCLEYKNNLILISKCKNSIWYQLVGDLRHDPSYFTWEQHLLNVNAIVISAISYLDNIYILGFGEKRTIMLYHYCPEERSCKELQSFKAEYDPDTTLCAFNVNKAMVFGNNVLECYCIDSNTVKEYSIQLDSFYSNYFFSIPIY